MFETKSRSCGGWFLKRHPAKWFHWNLPSRDPLRDPAALLTEEGHIYACSRPGFNHEIQIRINSADKLRRNERCRAVFTNDGRAADDVTMPQ